MKFTGKNNFQGDVQIFELSELPSGLKKIEKQFIAASEKSGSFHALFGNYDMYEAKGGFVIEAKEEEKKSILKETRAVTQNCIIVLVCWE